MNNEMKYVPVHTSENGNTVLKNIPFHRDHLFEEQARNTQWTYQDCNSPCDQLEGFEAEFADWHAKYNLYMVIEHNTKIMKQVLTK